MTHKKKIGTVAYYVVGILVAILAIIPFLWMVSTSLKARGALMSIPIEWIPKEPTIASYVKVFSKFPFFSTIGNSLFISVTYTIITLISASMAAFAFAKLKFSKADLLLKVFLATMMIPTQVTIIPLFVVMNKMSLINSYASVILPSIFRLFSVRLPCSCSFSKCGRFRTTIWMQPASTALQPLQFTSRLHCRSVRRHLQLCRSQHSWSLGMIISGRCLC